MNPYRLFHSSSLHTHTFSLSLPLARSYEAHTRIRARVRKHPPAATIAGFRARVARLHARFPTPSSLRCPCVVSRYPSTIKSYVPPSHIVSVSHSGRSGVSRLTATKLASRLFMHDVSRSRHIDVNNLATDHALFSCPPPPIPLHRLFDLASSRTKRPARNSRSCELSCFIKGARVRRYICRRGSSVVPRIFTELR